MRGLRSSPVARAIALRHQLFIALVVPAVLVIAVTAYLADLVARQALEASLGERLSSIAQSAATLVGPQVLLLDKGDDETRSMKNALAKLTALVQATGVERILIARLHDGATLIDSKEELKIGDEYTRARFDRAELESVAEGKSVASILFEGPEGRLYKTGYAPLFDQAGQVAAYAGVNAQAGFYRAITQLRTTLAAVALFGFLFLAGAAILSAKKVSVPLSNLSEAARRIGRGELDTGVPSGGPEEAVVLARTMRSMASSLRARDEEMQMMLAGIAHEVRNPLGGIELFGGLLREDLEESDPRRKHIDKILKELKVLARTVNDFLDFARHQPIETRQVGVADLLADVISISEHDAGPSGVTLELAADPNLSAELDPDALKRAVLNLVRNAIQASPPGGRVRVAAHRESGALVLEVDDQGPGVPASKRSEIFQPFFTTKEKGTGLGLALAKRAVDAHRGTIRVEEPAGGGARFVIELPPKNSA